MDSIQHMDFWFQKPPGSLVLEQEQRLLDSLLGSIAGDVLLQIGGPGQGRLFRSSQMVHHIYVSLDGALSESVPCFQADLDALPLRKECFDCIIVFHALAYAAHPERLLVQLQNALKPGGRLILFGFNKYSLWGLAKLRRDKRIFPWGGQFYPPWRVKRWLRTAGYTVLSEQPVCFRGPTVAKHKWVNSRYLEVCGLTLLPMFSGVYMLYAHKEQASITPLVNTGRQQQRKRYAQPAKPTLRNRN